MGRAAHHAAESARALAKREAVKHRSKLLAELGSRLERDANLSRAGSELELTKQLMGKGSKLKLRSSTPAEQDQDEEDATGKRKQGTMRMFRFKQERRR